MPSTMNDRFAVGKIDTGSATLVRAVVFSANGEYLVSANNYDVQVWRVEDCKEVATMQLAGGHACCLAVSRDGKWIAAGTEWGWAVMWDTKTYRDLQILGYRRECISGVDFSPDSTRLVVASADATATVVDVVTRQGPVLGPLDHDDYLTAAKYSPQGDRIATATRYSVSVWDSKDGCLLLEIPVAVSSDYNTGLLWLENRLLVASDDKIKHIDTLTGLTVLEWPTHNTDGCSSMTVLHHAEVVVCLARRTLTFRHPSKHDPLGFIQYGGSIHSIALSPNEQFLAIGDAEGQITIKKLSRIIEPDLQVDTLVLRSWMNGWLSDAETLLTTAISASRSSTYHLLASRALIRIRLQQWDAAIIDAEKVQPSMMGHIAKSMALVGKGEKHKGYRACDVAFEYLHPSHVSCLLLFKAIIVFMAGDREDAISRLDDLIAMVPFNSVCHGVQAYMLLLLGDSRMDSSDYEGAVQAFEHAQAKLRYYVGPPLFWIQLIFDWNLDLSEITIRQRICEALYAAGRTEEAVDSLLHIVSMVDEKVHTNVSITDWISEFARRCLSVPNTNGDMTSRASQRDEVPTLYTTSDSTAPTALLREWVKATLVSNSWRDTLTVAVNFPVPRFMTYRAMYEHLEMIQRTTEASECLCQMVDEFTGHTALHDEQVKWIVGKLESLGDIAMDAGRYDGAISQYSAALSLELVSPQSLLIKRSKAYMANDLWNDALNDADKVISLEPSSPWGYERKHAALHKAGDYGNAIDALEVMLSKMSQSPDLNIRERGQQYVDPEETRTVIRKAVQEAIRDSPRVLIDTTSGRLSSKSEQGAAFESLPVFKELISSVTTQINHVRIEHEVTEFYRYATFSHKWEENEPLFAKVISITVYDLQESLTHDKLQMFCKVVRSAGFNWAWSDTCCVNKADHFVLQEALVAMFKWYEGSSLTVVLLRGVRSPARRGDLVKSIWNTRGWTLQEYHASRVVRFYTEDWQPYLNTDIPNHKESPEIISEMEEATRISARALMALRPGLDDIREKLCLASRRGTTLVEDAAYSLLGIFSISLPIVYGEGDKALGRLLAQLLTSSGDTSILAWTGKSGSFNSCLPSSITVFNELPTTHIPPDTGDADLDAITAKLRGSLLNSTLVMKLYDRLHELLVPSFSGRRMKLPCLTFRLGPVSATRYASECVFRAKTAGLGVVEIKTTEDLTRLDSLTLVHPWIDFLLDRRPVGNIMDTISEENSNDLSSSMGDKAFSSGPFHSTSAAKKTVASRLAARLGLSFGTRPRDMASLLSPPPISPTEKRTQALRLIARLRQPFGALLLARTRQNVEEYRRVATESMIRVHIQEDLSLGELIEGARMLDVL